MPKQKRENKDETTELLRDLLIVNLGMAGLQNNEIRSVVGCDMNRVSKIVRHIRKRRTEKD